jgi:hypothetical protein
MSLIRPLFSLELPRCRRSKSAQVAAARRLEFSHEPSGRAEWWIDKVDHVRHFGKDPPWLKLAALLVCELLLMLTVVVESRSGTAVSGKTPTYSWTNSYHLWARHLLATQYPRTRLLHDVYRIACACRR